MTLRRRMGEDQGSASLHHRGTEGAEITEQGITWIAGVDGCKGGWFRICLNLQTNELRFNVIQQVTDLYKLTPSPSIIAIDMPIGLSDCNPRACDKEARASLGPRRNSVFPAPIRPALTASTHAEASAITESINGKRISAQAWGIYPKVKSVDEALGKHKELRSILFEVHPEISFWAWNKRQPMAFAKKRGEGQTERITLIEQWLGPKVVDQARSRFNKTLVANDDITDAFAALWSANRVPQGEAQTLPEYLETDSTGLPMQIVY